MVYTDHQINFHQNNKSTDFQPKMPQQNDLNPENKHILHSSIFNPTLRSWHGLNCEIGPNNLMYPVFITENDEAEEPITSMPGVSRMGVNVLRKHLEKLISKGLSSILVFGVTDSLIKDETGVNADSKENPIVRALPKLKKWFPNLTITCDVCLCPYTSSGHCGILNEDGSIDNAKSIKRIAEIALNYAKAGAHIVAPSDMMDGRIGAIKTGLIENGFGDKVAVLSYAAKFCSAFYGPFRDAAKSAPSFGDRKCYQLPPNGGQLALRAVDRDVKEGADFLMVKPALAYLDLVKETKTRYPGYPLFVYQVSGEYSMLYNAAKAGAFDLKTALTEVLTSMRRSGADVIITYFTPTILDWLQPKNKL